MKHASLAMLCIVGALVALLWQPSTDPAEENLAASESIALGASSDSERVLSSIKSPTEGQQFVPPSFQLPSSEQNASGQANTPMEQDQLDFNSQTEALLIEQKDIENMPLPDEDIALVDPSVNTER
jgi:type II secretory pathway pseudopilin PulG